MTEYISREAAIKSTWMVLEGMGYPRSGNRSLERAVESVLESAPAADVVEVVRCRECVHCCGVSGEPPFEEAYEAYCGEHDWCVSETYFCADGKRKDGGQDE